MIKADMTGLEEVLTGFRDAVLSAQPGVNVYIDMKPIADAIRAVANRPVTLSIPPGGFQLVMPETVETIEFERDADGKISAPLKKITRSK